VNFREKKFGTISSATGERERKIERKKAQRSTKNPKER
jgi:hypothetical protein